MTRLEKALELNPDRSAESIIDSYECPEDLIPGLKIATCPSCGCEDCWNREYKDGDQT